MRAFYLSWALGFMSGLNTQPNLLGKASNLAARATDYEQAFIDQYCDQRPLASYVQAVLSLYDTMRSEEGLHDWRPVPKY